MREIPRLDSSGTFTRPEAPQSRSGQTREEPELLRGGRREDGLKMKFPSCVLLSVTLLTVAVVPVCVGEMYTSLLNVRQAISVERRLIDYLRTYIDHEVERLQDVKR